MTVEEKSRRNEELATMENARVEYAATHDAYLHYDNFSWQVGSLLIAGVFVFWGFILDKKPVLTVLLVGDGLVCLIVSIWVLYATHNRQIYLLKLHRIHELETQLGMLQHRRFIPSGKDEPIYKVSKPSGHHFNNAIYLIVSAGGPLFTIFMTTPKEWQWGHYVTLILIASIVVIVLRHVVSVDRRTKENIRLLPAQTTSIAQPGSAPDAPQAARR
jgi:hypothetical protein